MPYLVIGVFIHRFFGMCYNFLTDRLKQTLHGFKCSQFGAYLHNAIRIHVIKITIPGPDKQDLFNIPHLIEDLGVYFAVIRHIGKSCKMQVAYL